MSNALNFSGDAPPQVRVEGRRDGAEWRFTVRDNGIGIEPRFHARFFRLFERLRMDPEYKGTDIGLALCRKIVLLLASSPGAMAFYFNMEYGRKPSMREAMVMMRAVEILLVEDNPGDVGLAREAMRDGKIRNNLNVVGDGEAAMAFLRQEGKYADAPRPDLILLDLNLPKKDGREVLAELKADPNLRPIPVVVLSMSEAEDDILHAYDLCANCYITKPINLDQFIHVVQSVEEFWFSIVQLPQIQD